MVAFDQKTALLAAGVLLIFLLAVAPPAAPGTVTKTLEIDANVFSKTFGDPIGDPTAPAPLANNPQMAQLIAQSNAVIAANPD